MTLDFIIYFCYNDFQLFILYKSALNHLRKESKMEKENNTSSVESFENEESAISGNEENIIADKEPQKPQAQKNSGRGEVLNFKKIKLRALILCIVKSLLVGRAIAAPVIGVVLLLNRFKVTSLDVWLVCLIGGLLFLIAGAITFLLLRQNSRTVAIKLDMEYQLEEKVQTMLAFKDMEGPMYDLQREDANRAIDSVKDKILGIKTLWIYIVCFVLSMGLFALSFMFNPLPEPDPEPIPEVPFEVSDLQLVALSDLIKYVEESEMDEPYRGKIVTVLNTLYENIQEATTEKERDAILNTAMDEIFLATDESSFAVELMDTLWLTNAQAAKLLAKALNYYEWPRSSEWDNFIEKMADYRAAFVNENAKNEDADEQAIIEETKNVLLTHKSGIIDSLTKLGVSEEDALYIVLNRLASANEFKPDGTRIYGMQALSEYLEQNGYTKAQRELDASITALTSDIYAALSKNKTNTDTGEYTMTTLASIFYIKAPAFERPNLEDAQGGSGDGGTGGSQGGISGGPTYGSDDKVYDPFTNSYVEYGTILDKYYSIMFNKLQGGSYTDDEKKALEEYFKILYGGFSETNENE